MGGIAKDCTTRWFQGVRTVAFSESYLLWNRFPHNLNA